ncbi:hypothetical protein [Fimbriimonas ginsengisoli]|uniref:Uncharacterized protein n=1 Tax=Fimbriimonas ginsengisoli Gsoil 348 TaxID=661478 RepID=A0A068NNA8_FIMGI|nr:hypothetical protein [Fimbriimonas ginsengisoli]AIE84941.1 hypothetical protein OP10G_1573 [Fimbriimonas ginsengisoli Gsoil 348]
MILFLKRGKNGSPVWTPVDFLHDHIPLTGGKASAKWCPLRDENGNPAGSGVAVPTLLTFPASLRYSRGKVRWQEIARCLQSMPGAPPKAAAR